MEQGEKRGVRVSWVLRTGNGRIICVCETIHEKIYTYVNQKFCRLFHLS